MDMTVRTITRMAALCIAAAALTPKAIAHCEIPCGIYGDRMRIDMIAEDITTVEKSMNEIGRLAGEDEKNWNQLVRWVNNKELHANKIQDVVFQYFMNQRVTPADDPESPEYQHYVEQITLLHKMLVAAMKCKQTTDLEHVASLRRLLEQFADAYFADEEGEAEHRHEH